MSTEPGDNDELPEEEAGIEVGTMNADFDEGDEIPSLKSTDITASFEATWRHNAGEIYKSTASAIDEGLGNAITAVRRAHRLFGAWDAGVIVRIEERSEEEVYLTLRDEGVGMTEEFIDSVLSDIGTTTGVVGEGVNSKFGRGFFSLFMLVGEGKNDASGSFTMSTNPRMEDEGGEIEPPYHVLFKPGKVDYVRNNSAALSEDEYGTRLRFCVRDGITADDLEEWVRDYATYSRTPIMFERKYPDGSMENDELGGKELEHNYSEDSAKVVVERNGMYRAVASPEAEGKVIILDAQTETSANLTFPIYRNWNVDIRLLSEDGPIYESPDDDRIGKIPIPEEEIDDVPKNKRHKYIAKSEIDEYNDKRMAEPSGTRDIIDLDKEFLEDVFNRLKEKAISRIRNATSELSEPDDWTDLTDEQATLIGNIIENPRHKWNLASVVGDDTLDLLATLSKRLKVVERGAELHDRHDIRHSNYKYQYAYELQAECNRVYYGNSILQRRADAVWADSEDNAVVKVKTDQYDVLDELGWKKITEITSTTVDDLDVPESVVEEFKSVYTKSSSDGGVADDYDDRKIKVHHRKYPKTMSATVGSIRDYFGDDLDGYEGSLLDGVGRLVVFTSTSDHTISNHKSLVDNYTATAKCVNKVFEEKLSHLDKVIRYEEYGDHNADYELLTNEGRLPVSELSERSVRLVHVTDEWKTWLEKTTRSSSVGVLSNLQPDFDGVVAVATKYDLYAIRSHIERLPSDTLDNSVSLVESLYIKHGDMGLNLDYDGRKESWMRVVNARFPNWDKDETPEMRCLINTFSGKNTDEKQTILDEYGPLHDNDAMLSSDRNGDITTQNTTDITLETNKGKLTVEEIKESNMKFGVFALSDDVKNILSSVPISTVKEYLADEIGSTFRTRIDYDKDNYILAVEDYETAQRLAREMDVHLIRPRYAPSVASTQCTQRPSRTYTSLYAYHKACKEGVSFDALKTARDTELVSEGYHFVNTTANLLAE